jgi:hypothetical protein
MVELICIPRPPICFSPNSGNCVRCACIRIFRAFVRSSIFRARDAKLSRTPAANRSQTMRAKIDLLRSQLYPRLAKSLVIPRMRPAVSALVERTFPVPGNPQFRLVQPVDSGYNCAAFPDGTQTHPNEEQTCRGSLAVPGVPGPWIPCSLLSNFGNDTPYSTKLDVVKKKHSFNRFTSTAAAGPRRPPHPRHGIDLLLGFL